MIEIKRILESNQYHLATELKTSSNFFEHVYSCDLLSAVIKHGKDDVILITQISSITTIGVAVMLDLPAVILTEGKLFDRKMIQKANEEEIALIHTNLASTEVIIDFKNRQLL